MTLLHRLSLLILALALGPALGPETAAAETLAAWVQLIGPGRDASIRAITDGAPCPTLKADGADLPMLVRAKPGRLFKRGTGLPRANFQVLVCEVMAPPGKASVLLEGKPLPVPPPDIRRIVVFGDTGCRIKKTKIQDCRLDWPYHTLASHAAEAHPDLVIHVGDYLYRESCTAGKTKCPNTRTGYGWDVWNEDFFTPSAPLFAAAPWIMVRGNHESCARAGEGWFRFLDHARPADECIPLSGFFVIALGDLGFVVMDSGQIANDKGIDVDDDDDEDDGDTAGSALPRNVAGTIRRSFAGVARRVPSPAWLLTHAPFNAVKVGKATGKDQVVNTIQQQAIGDLLPKDIEMIVSGHVHMFEALSFANANPPRAPQLVVGTGGVKLAKKPDKPADIDGIAVIDPFILKDFAYIVWDRDGTSWDGKLFDADGAKLARCTLADRALACKKE